MTKKNAYGTFKKEKYMRSFNDHDNFFLLMSMINGDEYEGDRGRGGRVRGRPRLGWMDGVNVALGNRGMTVEAARQCAKDRKE